MNDEVARLNPIAQAIRIAADDAFVRRWVDIYLTRDLHSELEALKVPGKFIRVGRAIFHAYHAEIDAYIQGREEPEGGFDTSLGGTPVYCDRSLAEDEIKIE